MLPAFTPIKIPNIDDIVQKQIDAGDVNGCFCTDVREPIPFRKPAICEVAPIKGKNNSFIILGRDRPGNLISGAGGVGYTQCGMIDLVAGMAALNSANELKQGNQPVGEEEKLHPNFITDAARIYITQKAINIDEYFGFKNDRTPESVIKFKSAVGIKADHARLIGRETVRIYCGGAQNVEGFGKDGETNSIGGRLFRPKIELIAGNESNLQPAVLGTNLKRYLNRLEAEHVAMREGLAVVAQNLISINGVLTVLTSGVGPFSANMLDNIGEYMNNIIAMMNSEIRAMTDLDSLEFIGGKRSILSKSVFVS
jgi:hypothetical protein